MSVKLYEVDVLVSFRVEVEASSEGEAKEMVVANLRDSGVYDIHYSAHIDDVCACEVSE